MNEPPVESPHSRNAEAFHPHPRMAGARPSLPAVVDEGYRAWLWLDERVASFPVLARRLLGQRIVAAALDALVPTVEASLAGRGRERAERLIAANRSLTLLRILLRAARDRRHLSVAQHEHAMRLLDSWGRQIGGWLRAERAAERRSAGTAAAKPAPTAEREPRGP